MTGRGIGGDGPCERGRWRRSQPPAPADQVLRLTGSPSAARSTAAISIRFMVSIACMARCALVASVINASRRFGTILLRNGGGWVDAAGRPGGRAKGNLLVTEGRRAGRRAGQMAGRREGRGPAPNAVPLARSPVLSAAADSPEMLALPILVAHRKIALEGVAPAAAQPAPRTILPTSPPSPARTPSAQRAAPTSSYEYGTVSNRWARPT
jgi:hypothetical protein